ncbi:MULTISPECIES: sugar phosphate isomerase/epimerase family protein [Gracilibacillus]|uniref:sugar phosphate isomerase/epimerase family protein n=1 Tax=Gracilibacillus TaxID=74385 RepID=UPI000825ED51|nr:MULTISPECIES: sugar phosphate isomerase/epimerase [Gracilibacillus]
MSLKVGVQLFSVRQSLQESPLQTLEDIAKAGYKYIEAANHNAQTDDGVGFNLTAKEMRQALDQFGLEIVGCHVNPLDLDRLPAVLDYHQELGNTQIGCDIEFFPYQDKDYVLRRCELFNKVGEMCKQRGMRYYYHNHYQEFQQFGDQTVYDIIMENTNPELVFAEMDTYWIARAGQDPLELIQKYKDRLVLLHQKDFPERASQPLNMYDGVIDPNQEINFGLFDETVDPQCFTEIGTGVLPIQAIIDTANTAPNLDYILLEQDHTSLDEIESIQKSMKAFQKYTGVTWK